MHDTEQKISFSGEEEKWLFQVRMEIGFRILKCGKIEDSDVMALARGKYFVQSLGFLGHLDRDEFLNYYL